MHMLIVAFVSSLTGILFGKRNQGSKNMVFKKSLRDLLIHPGRTLLVIFALFIGLWGAGTILVSWFILNKDMDRNFLATSPLQVSLKSDNFHLLDLENFRKRKDIEAAELRDLTILRMEVAPGKWLPLWLYGVSDFNNFTLAKVYPQEGRKIPAPHTISVERDIENVRGAMIQLGSEPNIRVGGINKQVKISGIVFDPAQAPATQDTFVYGYTDKKTWSEITGKKADKRLIVRFNNVSSMNDVKSSTKNLIEDFKSQGIKINHVDLPKFNKHPHQFQLNTLLVTNGIIGFLAFIMGAVLVMQLMKVLLSRQVREIGIMKAIGASRMKILRIYILMVLAIGVISSSISVPLLVLTGYAYAGFVAKILNFNILTTKLPHGMYITLSFMGIFLPLIFTMPAILKAIRVSAHKALSDYGISMEKEEGKVIKIGKYLSAQWRLALRNTFRQKKRIGLTVMSMALGVAIFSTGFNVKESLHAFLMKNQDSMKYDVQVVFNREIPKDKALEPFKNMDKVEKIETWNGGKGRLQSQIISLSDPLENQIGIVALPYDTDLMKFEIIKGSWLKPQKETPEVVANQLAAEALGYDISAIDQKIGKLIPLNLKGKKINVRLSGVAREFDKAKLYINKEEYDRWFNPDRLVNSLMFVLKTKTNDMGKLYDEKINLKKEIEERIKNSDLSVLYVMSNAERAKIIYDHLVIILSVLTFLAFLVLGVSALGTASNTGISILERTREIGAMKAVGAMPRKIYSLFVKEGLITSLTAILAGIVLGLPLSFLGTRYFGYLILGANTPLNLSISFSGEIITLVLTILFGWLASLIPARKVLKLSAREALAYE